MVFYPSLLPIIGDLGPVPMLTGHLGQEKKILLGTMAKGKRYLNEEDQKGFPEDGPCTNHRETSNNGASIVIN